MMATKELINKILKSQNELLLDKIASDYNLDPKYLKDKYHNMSHYLPNW
jgi:hypothetical protein